MRKLDKDIPDGGTLLQKMKCVENETPELYVRWSVSKMDQVHLNIIGKFYLVDQIEMETDNKIIEVFFEFLKHMEKMTDVIESMAHKMEEMDERIKVLERKPHKRNEDDSEGMSRLP